MKDLTVCENDGRKVSTIVLAGGTKHCVPCYHAALNHGRLHVPEEFDPNTALPLCHYKVTVTAVEQIEGDEFRNCGTMVYEEFETFADCLKFIELHIDATFPCLIEQI